MSTVTATRFHRIETTDDRPHLATFVARVAVVDEATGAQAFSCMSASGWVPANWTPHPLAIGDRIRAHHMDHPNGEVQDVKVTRINAKSVGVCNAMGQSWRVQVVL